MRIKVLNFDYEKLPFRAHENDAGADVSALEDVAIPAHHTVKIPLGFGLVLPDGYMACIYSRSSLASKGIVCQNPPIDSGYRGEIHAIVSNLTDNYYVVHKGDRVGQLVITPVVVADFITEDFKQRGDGAFGSTGI